METVPGLWLLSDIYVSLNRIIEAMRVCAEAKSISTKIDSSANDPATEALFRRAVAEKDKGDLQSCARGFNYALTALCLTITGGIHRSPAGAHQVDRLRLLFKSYGIGQEEWEWVSKHAHLTKYDFVGILSVLLHQTGHASDGLNLVVKQKHRVIEVR